MASSLSLKEPAAERRQFVARAITLFAFAMLLVGMLVVRLLQLQVWEHEAYQTRSEDNRIEMNVHDGLSEFPPELGFETYYSHVRSTTY